MTRKSSKYYARYMEPLDSCFDLIRSQHWRPNQRPQNADPKFYHWATGPHLASLVCDADQSLNDRVSILHSGAAGSLISREENGIHCWWDIIRSKEPSSGSVCPTQCLPDFLVMVIQLNIIIYILLRGIKSFAIYMLVCCAYIMWPKQFRVW